MRVKICGITKAEQGNAIAKMGATALGFICVRASPRYVTPAQIGSVVDRLSVNVDRIGVFANSTVEEICQVFAATGLSGVQLHGSETPEFCDRLRQSLPNAEIIKAFRVQTSESLTSTKSYFNAVDTLLLDAYHPDRLGGTGQTLEWNTLQKFYPDRPWFLAGGLTPDNILDALRQVNPSGIDLSSGVESSPGEKDLDKTALLFKKLKNLELGKVKS